MGKIWTPDGTESESQGQGSEATIKYLMNQLNQAVLMIERLAGIIVAHEDRIKKLEDIHVRTVKGGDDGQHAT